MKHGWLYVCSLVCFGIANGAAAETLRLGSQSDAVTLDPHRVNDTFNNMFLANVYEGLVGRDRAFAITPLLAESWKLVDATTWVFKLRSGVKFQNGEPFTAADVVFSLDRAQSATSNFRSVLTSIQGVRAVDPMTVEIKTKGPNPLLLNDLLDIAIVSKAWATANNALAPSDGKPGASTFSALNANGTGPYRVTSRSVGEKTVFDRNEHYWAKTGNIDKVIFSPIANAGTLVSALLSGEVDLVIPLPTQDIGRVSKAPGLTVLTSDENRTMFIGLNQARSELADSSVKGKNPYQDVRVRQAVAHAIDAPAIVNRVMGGHATLATQDAMDKVDGFNKDIKRLAYDPAKAKALLAEAGYPDGFTVGMDCPSDRWVNDGQICQAVSSMLSKVGIKVNLSIVPKINYFPKISAPGYESSTFLQSWAPSSMDTYSTFRSQLMTRNPANGIGVSNAAGCSDPEVDRLATEASTEMEPAKRLALLRQAMAITAANVCIVPLHTQKLVWGMKRNLSVVQHPNFDFPIKYFNFGK